GAVAAAGYFLTGSRLRRRFSLLTHLFVVYSVAAVLLAIAVPVTGGSFTGLPARSYLYCLLMAVVCQGAGHSMFNWALKRMSATTVTFSILAEPVGTTLLALLILSEVPAAGEVVGGAVILVGIFVVARFDPRVRGEREKGREATRA
ncbi:MAG TPA: DMT family transporter, partial [Candidatus Krumholzibacterium sp.]|nr:DMT family transporter [Candidatus Krumholzibacterium sp.]